MPFGYHLMLDVYNCEPNLIDDLDYCYDYLDQLTTEIGMDKQSPPFIFRSPNTYPGKEGLSGWVPVIESGISIHTLTATKFISVDVYSCKKFNVDKIKAFTKRYFKIKNDDDLETNYVFRGVKYDGIENTVVPTKPCID